MTRIPMKSRLPHLLGALLLLALAAGPAHAQFETRGVALLGTGGGGPAYVYGTDALLFNPANLVLDGEYGRVTVTLGNVYAFSGGDLLQFAPYTELLQSGRVLTSEEVGTALDDWFGDAETLRHAGLTADAVPLAFAYRRSTWAVGAAVRARSYHHVSLNRGWLDLLLVGTGEDRSVPMNGAFRSLSTIDVSVAYSHRFPELGLAVGIAPKVVLGTTYSDGTFASTADVTADAIVHRFAYEVKAAGALNSGVVGAIHPWTSDPFADVSMSNPFGGVSGTGFGVDLGATYQLRPDLRVALSLTDLGTVSWSMDAQTITPVNAEFRFEGLELDRDRLDDEFDGKLGDYAESVLDSLARDAYEQVERVDGAFSTALPAGLHLGGAWRPIRRATVNAGTSVALNDAAGNLGGGAVFYAGGEYRLGPVPLRTGVRVGGSGAFTVGAGIGVRTRVYEMGLSVAVSPRTDLMGRGGRYTLGFTLASVTIP